MAEFRDLIRRFGAWNGTAAVAAVLVLAVWAWSAPEFGTLKDTRDGKSYKTVKIGEQTWMAENLNCEYKIGGKTFQNGTNAEYGRVYTWTAAMAGTDSGFFRVGGVPDGARRGVCPEGWHLPDTADWNALFAAAGGKAVAGAILKSSSGWAGDGNGCDSCGFSALPSVNQDDGSFGLYAEFWSSTLAPPWNDVDRALYAFFRHDDAAAGLKPAIVGRGASVRCVKD